MKGIYSNILASCLIGIILFSGCSVTKHLPEGEVLYTVVVAGLDHEGQARLPDAVFVVGQQGLGAVQRC